MRALLDLLIPPVCPGCRLEGTSLCDACGTAIRRRAREPAGVPLGVPAALPHALLQVEWCAVYSGPTRAAIAALKYGGERRLVAPLAAALAERWTFAAAGGDLVTWVPVHPSRRRERGFDQAELLARATAVRIGLPVLDCLERRRRTVAQHRLGQLQRSDNLAGAFGVPSAAQARVQGRWVVVVDDILTTGATLSSCAAALMEAGAWGVSAITLARDR